ncbi:hypothetical protein B0H17DRAFT_1141306 [Mycena rosella]|uniref:Uncharacterized protein n=1 Tax=Mycena rosella TaxID=1033263 RepID=A0AAD7CZZ6_MYCRO|nr:hypothetical protein B0H17DRAFT_1141306 [Mycena rosella]
MTSFGAQPEFVERQRYTLAQRRRTIRIDVVYMCTLRLRPAPMLRAANWRGHHACVRPTWALEAAWRLDAAQRGRSRGSAGYSASGSPCSTPRINLWVFDSQSPESNKADPERGVTRSRQRTEADEVIVIDGRSLASSASDGRRRARTFHAAIDMGLHGGPRVRGETETASTLRRVGALICARGATAGRSWCRSPGADARYSVNHRRRGWRHHSFADDLGWRRKSRKKAPAAGRVRLDMTERLAATSCFERFQDDPIVGRTQQWQRGDGRHDDNCPPPERNKSKGIAATPIMRTRERHPKKRAVARLKSEDPVPTDTMRSAQTSAGNNIDSLA